MAARILDGRSVADRILNDIRAEIEARGAARPPSLCAVLVGDDPASQLYVRNKIQACARCGIESRLERLPPSATSGQVAALLDRLGADPGVDGVLLQLPLPPGLRAAELLLHLAPAQDVDGLHPLNLGRLVTEDPDGFVPCTPAGVIELLRAHEIDIRGRRAVILGRSTLVGKPLALLLLRRGAAGDATVTVVHTASRDVPEIVRGGDLVVAAVGKPGFVRGEWLRPGAIVVDVGIHRLPDGRGGTRIAGDVDFESASAVAGALTPVPGGVGRMTVAMLLRNTLLAWKRKLEA